MSDITTRLEELRKTGLFRRMRMVSGPQGPRVLLDGRRVLLLCSNNYLGLADHPRVREAAAQAAMRYGAGAGASRLVSGNMTLHRRLEERLAAFKRTERCVVFGSGYLANVGVITALAEEGDVIFSDSLNHASIIDGCRLARAETFVYDHLDTEHLEWGLQEADGRGVTVHTIDCGRLAEFEDREELWRDLQWTPEAERNAIALARLTATIRNAPGVLGQACTVIGEAGGNIVGLRMHHRQQDYFDVDFDIEVTDARHLTHIAAALRANPSVETSDRPKG